jgi:hypothetical protein
MPRLVERSADRRHHAVHHPARRHDVRARVRVCHCDAAEDLQGGVVVDTTVAENTTMAVAGVFAAADVGEEEEIGMARAEPAQGALHDAVGREVLAADLVLGGRQAEEQNGGNAGLADAVHLAIERVVHGEVANARHRADLALHFGTVGHENGLNEIGGVELMLADESAQGVGPAPTPWPVDLGCGHGGKTRDRKAPPQPVGTRLA